ncbi:hypothetical protein JI749_01090 [Devosia oryziradicis]|uniref:Uncharacterized protein n=1 Tax=Devosia oryziradicis TaxID=2801335 RepID=A0ABX7C0T1_9HYPH|nr:hypothetical protein [Devosia oryziradicis]QQR36265.1 hypothetical protein JI749_01090 [Devosia oryziradicis]
MGAIVVLWLVFSVLKKLVGLVILAALAAAGFVLWQNPALWQALVGWLQSLA